VVVSVEGAPFAESALLGASAFLALDRPDRLEVRASMQPAAAARLESRLGPGKSLCMVLGGGATLEGTVDRVAWSSSRREGRCVSVVAYSSYHELRRRHGTQVHYQVTDAELAARLAAYLGLVPVVDGTVPIHPRVVVEGDPLAFLRGRARACGFHLAVTSGKLYFTKDIPRSEEFIALAAGREILDVEVLEQGGVLARAAGPVRRGGRLEVPGSPRWRPLAGFKLEGLASGMDGRYLVMRALHRVGARGYVTAVEFLEEGLDVSGWMDATGGTKSDLER
jgi:hypothetical protein